MYLKDLLKKISEIGTAASQRSELNMTVAVVIHHNKWNFTRCKILSTFVCDDTFLLIVDDPKRS
jgi:hypothetical protein